jgi:hypothetical protein
MNLKAFCLKTTEFDNFFEEIEYTPPKHVFDNGSFNNSFSTGTLGLPDTQIIDRFRELNPAGSPKDFGLQEEGPPIEIKMNFMKHEPVDADRLSVAESFKHGAQTVTTATPESTASIRCGEGLNKRSPKKTDWITLKIPKDEELIQENEEKGSEKEFFVNTMFGNDIAYERITKLALRIIDRVSPVLDQEWLLLSSIDRQTLATYLAQVFGQKLQTVPDLETPAFVNDLMALKLIRRRNEERLNKTVKQVNSLIAESFANINKFSDDRDKELVSALQTAYFGDSYQGDVFASGTVFSQKNFGELVKFSRYAEDFEAVLNKSYVGEVIRSRKQKVLKEIKAFRKLLQEGQDPIAQIDHKNKRSPWLLEDIVEGAKLCQNIIDSRKIT